MSELSIIIRTFNCRDVLRECLALLDRQTLRDAERLVVDSGSTDGTVEAAEAGGARVLCRPAGGFTYGGTLNHGYEAAQGRYLCSLSAHSLLLEPTTLERLVGALKNADDRVAGVYGCPVFDDERARVIPDAGADRITYRDFQARSNLGLSNSCSVIRRDLWEAFPFPPERCEDQKWAAHYLAQGYATLCLQGARYRYRLNRSMAYYVRKHRDDFLMLHRTWPEAAWPREELHDGARLRYRCWSMLQRLRQAGWNWDRLTDTQKWYASMELGMFWAGSKLRGGRFWWPACAADLARVILLPKARKGWLAPSGEWP
jgi:rhamnosyltransferase